jgi:hypothetical protein
MSVPDVFHSSGRGLRLICARELRQEGANYAMKSKRQVVFVLEESCVSPPWRVEF